MIEDKRAKSEASMPMQSRVDLSVLAELLIYWEKKGVYIKSVSQLISWSLEAFRGAVYENNLLPVSIDTLEEAYEVLTHRGLISRKHEERISSKLFRARGFENIRMDEGIVDENMPAYKHMHKVDAVKPYDGVHVNTGNVSREFIIEKTKEALKVDKQLQEAKITKSIESQKEIAYANPKIVKLENECSGKDIGGGILIDKDELMQRARANDEALKNF